jgi:hypothetical protein
LLDRKGIEEAFRRLGDRLAKRGVVADIYVFGGAAMALAYDSRRATRDVDALFKPHGIVLEEAQAVAADLGLPHWWLNEQLRPITQPDPKNGPQLGTRQRTPNITGWPGSAGALWVWRLGCSRFRPARVRRCGRG